MCGKFMEKLVRGVEVTAALIQIPQFNARFYTSHAVCGKSCNNWTPAVTLHLAFPRRRFTFFQPKVTQSTENIFSSHLSLKCNNRFLRNLFPHSVGSATPYSKNLPTETSCVNWNQYYTNCTQLGGNPFQGTISFDNIGLAWVAIFLVIMTNHQIISALKRKTFP